MKGFILYPSYKIIDGKSYVFLFGKLENGESFLVMNFYEPYFYIKTKDVKKAGNGDFKIENSDFKSFNDEKLSRVILETPKDVPGLRRSFEEDGIECYEADIRFAYRYLMDKGIMMGVEIDGDYETSDFINRIYRDAEIKPIEYFPNNLKIFSVDIETSSNGKKLYSIAIYSEGFEKVLIDMDEEEMLEEFKKIILEEDPDIITGWNLIDFDLEYLKNKFKEHRISFVLGRTNETCKIRIEKDFFRDSKADFPGRVVLDGIQLLRMSFVDLDSYKLEDAAQSILKEGKLISYIEGKGEEIDRLFREDKKKLAKYNLNDARLVTEILKKTKIIEMTIERSILTGMPLDRVNASIASLDSLYLRELNKRGYVANSGHYTPKEERIKGGYVMESKPGIYDYLLVLDQDVIPPPNVIEQLIRHKKDAVSALFFGHHNIGVGKLVMPFAWAFIEKKDFWGEVGYLTEEEIWSNELIEIAYAGMGCILIARNILEKVEFRYDKSIDAWDDRWLGYDIHKNGFGYYLDTSVKCRHLYLNRPFDYHELKGKGLV